MLTIKVIISCKISVKTQPNNFLQQLENICELTDNGKNSSINHY